MNRTKKATSKNLPEEEFLKFRDELSSRKEGFQLAVLATVQCFQALRVSEAAALHWEDIHFDWKSPENSRIKVVRAVCWLRKKNSPAFIKLGFKNSDANQGMKEQSMFPETFDALLKLYRDGAKGMIFQVDGKPMSFHLLQSRYDRAFKDAGLPYSGTHIMRHGGCSRLFDSEKGDLGLEAAAWECLLQIG